MPRHRHTSKFLCGAMLALAAVSATGCETPSDVPDIPGVPSTRPDPVNDASIGRGVAAAARVAGTEHNRLALALLRWDGGRMRDLQEVGARCTAIVEGLSLEAAETARAASIPGREMQLVAIMQATMAANRRCEGHVVQPTVAGLFDDVPVTLSDHRDSVLTDAAFAILDQLQSEVANARWEGELNGALQSAIAAASSLGALDRLAVESAVAQSQGSSVLWESGGAGWDALGLPIAPQYFFRKRKRGFFSEMREAIGADLAGCGIGLATLRSLWSKPDPRVMVAACGFPAAGASVLNVYDQFHRAE